MGGQWTIFDQMTDTWRREAENLRQRVEELRKENKALLKEKEDNTRALDSAPWNEQSEISADIRYCEQKIKENDKEIETCLAKMQSLQKEIQEQKNIDKVWNKKVK